MNIRVPIIISLSVLLLALPHSTHAATSSKLEFSGWLPYWRVASSTKDVLPHVSQLTEINPFGYTVKSDGSLNDAAKIDKSEWQTLFTAARKAKTRVIPTIMWSDTQAIHAVLSDPAKRSAHVAAIVSMVKEKGFDGVDIDYEGKLADDRDNYVAFLKELSAAFGKNKLNKWLMCTIEARTPPKDLYHEIPADLEYANDLKAIGTYCDRVRLMTYDQQRADLTLNKTHEKDIYAPIADPAWIRKVVALMAKDIDKKKIVLGVATYGYTYQVMPFSDGTGYAYTQLETFNPTYGTDTAKAYGITPWRTASGELAFTYVPKDTPASLPSQSLLASYAPKGTVSALKAAAGSLALVQKTGRQGPVTLVWWSDATAIQQKVALARELGLRGVAIFKMDGGEDQGIWKVLK